MARLVRCQPANALRANQDLLERVRDCGSDLQTGQTIRAGVAVAVDDAAGRAVAADHETDDAAAGRGAAVGELVAAASDAEHWQCCRWH